MRPVLNIFNSEYSSNTKISKREDPTVWPPWGVFYGVGLEAYKVTDGSRGCKASALNRAVWRADLTFIVEGSQEVAKYKHKQQSVSKETHFLLNKNIIDFKGHIKMLFF